MNYSSSSSSAGGNGNSGKGVSEAGQAGEVAAEQPFGAEQTPLPHVSEEAAAIDRIMNKKKGSEDCSVDGTVGGPELEQGTPVEDVWFSTVLAVPFLYGLI